MIEKIQAEIDRIGFGDDAGSVDSIVVSKDPDGVLLTDDTEWCVCDPDRLYSLLCQVHQDDWEGLWRAAQESEV